jgi:hypothetical protein
VIIREWATISRVQFAASLSFPLEMQETGVADSVNHQPDLIYVSGVHHLVSTIWIELLR